MADDFWNDDWPAASTLWSPLVASAGTVKAMLPEPSALTVPLATGTDAKAFVYQAMFTISPPRYPVKLAVTTVPGGPDVTESEIAALMLKYWYVLAPLVSPVASTLCSP